MLKDKRSCNAAIAQYINHKPALLDRGKPNDVATMQGFLIIVGILLGLLGIVESGRCISEDEINKLIERKMETAMKKYDRKIALLEEKIHSHEKKIRTLEEKRSSLGAEEEGKNFIRVHTVNKQDTNTIDILQKNPEQKPTNGHVAKKRIVPGIYVRYVFNFLKKNLKLSLTILLINDYNIEM